MRVVRLEVLDGLADGAHEAGTLLADAFATNRDVSAGTLFIAVMILLGLVIY